VPVADVQKLFEGLGSIISRGLARDEIAAALTRHNIPFVFVTGYGREALPHAFREATVLSKPFGRPEMLEAAAR
jgi:hypothetical protein